MNLNPLFFLSCQELRRGVPYHPLFYFGCSSILLMETRGPKKDYNMCTVTGWVRRGHLPSMDGWGKLCLFSRCFTSSEPQILPRKMRMITSTPQDCWEEEIWWMMLMTCGSCWQKWSDTLTDLMIISPPAPIEFVEDQSTFGGSDSKESACKARSMSPEDLQENGMATHFSILSYLDNSIDRKACWATIHGGHKELDMNKRLTLSLSFSISHHWNPAADGRHTGGLHCGHVLPFPKPQSPMSSE